MRFDLDLFCLEASSFTSLSVEGKRFNSLHMIAHGIDRKYGTPLDEIRISTMEKRPPIEKALRRIREVNK